MKNNKKNSNYVIENLEINLGKIEIPQINKFIEKKVIAKGVFNISKHELEQLKVAGRKVELEVFGMLIIDKKVTLELFKSTIEKIKVKGIVHATSEIKEVIKTLK